MIKETTIYDFKTHFSSYLKDLEQEKYDAIIVKRRDEVVGEFRLKKPEKKKNNIQWGIWEGEFEFNEALFKSMDAEIAYMLENSKIFPDEE